MTREFLEQQGVPADRIEAILKAHGVAIQAEQAKKGSGKSEEEVQAAVNEALLKQKTGHEAAVATLNTQITTLQGQKAEVDKLLKEAPNLDEAVKEALKKQAGEHATALSEREKQSKAQIADLQRDAETVDFLRTLPNKFVTPETETVFRQKLNDALQDTANANKNRADLFAEMIKGADGKERTDIFAQAAAPPNGAAGGGGGETPGEEGSEFAFSFTGIRGRDAAPANATAA